MKQSEENIKKGVSSQCEEGKGTPIQDGGDPWTSHNGQRSAGTVCRSRQVARAVEGSQRWRRRQEEKPP